MNDLLLLSKLTVIIKPFIIMGKVRRAGPGQVGQVARWSGGQASAHTSSRCAGEIQFLFCIFNATKASQSHMQTGRVKM